MKKNITYIVMLMTLTMSLGMVYAGDFQINDNTGASLFNLTSAGNLEIVGTISENGALLSSTYLALTGGSLSGNVATTGEANITAGGFFVGDGSFITGITVEAQATTVSYHNITDLPTCNAGEHFTFDGSTLSCSLPTTQTMNIAGENITSGTIDFARLPTLTNMHTLDYHNITSIPTCDAGDYLAYDGSDLACGTPEGGDFTNVAYYNQTNTFATDQVFSQDVNVTGDVNLMSATASLKRGGTNITIDDTNNIIITLGS